MHAPHLHSSTLPNDKKGKIMDPIKLMARRYSMMIIHFCILLALIFVATFQVRSAILLGINATSAAIFLIYVPRSAYLAWREGRNGIGYGAKVRKKGDRKNSAGRAEGGGMDEWEDNGERRGWTWDCAGLEVGYLGLQCGTTLVAAILCALTLSSSECFGPADNTAVFVLDEFANLKERGQDHWCHGVVGATVLSFIQFGLDLAWLGWVISVIRVESGVRGGQEGMELKRRASEAVSGYPPYEAQPASSPTMATSPNSHSAEYDDAYHPKPHAFHLLQTLLTPTPRLLTALAQRRAAAEAESQRAAAAAASAYTPRWDGQPAQSLQLRGTETGQQDPLSTGLGREDIAVGRSLRPEDLEVDPHPHGAEGNEVLPPYVAPPYIAPRPVKGATSHEMRTNR